MAVNAPGSGAEVEVINVVASGTLDRDLDLRTLGADLPAAEVSYGAEDYDPSVLYIRRRPGGPPVSVYRSGKYHVTGIKSLAGAQPLRDWFIERMDELGIDEVADSFAVRNVLAVGDIGRDLYLNGLLEKLGYEHAGYDPAVDGALMYRPDEIGPVFRMYSTGQVTIYGDSPAAIDRAFDWLRRKL